MKRTIALAFLVALVSLVFQSACSSSAPPAGTAQPPATHEKAPAEFKVKFDTSKGAFIVEVHRDWSKNGADRFYELVKTGYYNDARFFRVIKNFVVQWGINKDPKVSELWRQLEIQDDGVKESNRRGYLTYAMAGPNTRTTQVFINLKDNVALDAQGFAPIGRVSEGMDIVDSLYSGYGDEPQQNLIQTQGNAYLENHYPRMDYIKTAGIAP